MAILANISQTIMPTGEIRVTLTNAMLFTLACKWRTGALLMVNIFFLILEWETVMSLHKAKLTMGLLTSIFRATGIGNSSLLLQKITATIAQEDAGNHAPIQNKI